MAHRIYKKMLPLNFKVILIMLMVSSHGVIGMRRYLTDSIMDIMDRSQIERRLNASREEKRLLSQNDLEENIPDNEQSDILQPHEIAINFDLNGPQYTQSRPMDVLMRYNDSVIPYSPLIQQSPETDLLADLQSFRADKLLKSSKNALFVTRKEYLKKDWCKTEPLVQRIREDGCLSRNIINRFCYGQCNSFYIPKSPKRNRMNRLKRLWNPMDEFEPEDLTGAAFRSCAFCKPKKFTWITVTLRCPSLVPQLRRKKIQRIKQCKCIAEPLN